MNIFVWNLMSLVSAHESFINKIKNYNLQGREKNASYEKQNNQRRGNIIQFYITFYAGVFKNNKINYVMQKGKDIPLRIYADGVFDSFHIGHANMFKQCRENFPGQKIWVVAGVCNQEQVEQFKGPTVSSEAERIQMVRQCKWIDEVIPKAPWIITEQFLNQHDIDFVCHDDAPYVTNDANGEVDDAYGLCKKLGRFKATQRTQGISTTDLVTKILKNKEIYYVRNIRRGTSREKLGISRIRYFYLMCKMYLCPQIYEKKKKS